MFTRECPKCGNTIVYKYKESFYRQKKKNSVCRLCNAHRAGQLQSSRKRIGDANRGRNNGMYGKHAVNYGISDSQETLEKKRRAQLGKNNSFYNHKHTEETKKKIRLSQIESLKRRFGSGVCPTYNKIACHRIDDYGKQHGYSFQHALNGGEFYIKELGYWVDGYDKDRNAVIEYYEKQHRRTKSQTRDQQRMNEIVGLLGCEFIILKEWESIPTITNQKGIIHVK